MGEGGKHRRGGMGNNWSTWFPKALAPSHLQSVQTGIITGAHLESVTLLSCPDLETNSTDYQASRWNHQTDSAGHDLWISTLEIKTVCRSSRGTASRKHPELPVLSNSLSELKENCHLSSTTTHFKNNETKFLSLKTSKNTHLFKFREVRFKLKNWHLKKYYSCCQIKFGTILLILSKHDLGARAIAQG